MSDPNDLLIRNRAWAAQIKLEDPEFFHRLAAAQQPKYLWIGCADSRVPANEILGLIPAKSSSTATWPMSSSTPI
ncbi:MAG: hypothetical protein WDN28_04690 [Chthoniobacter sp.]